MPYKKHKTVFKRLRQSLKRRERNRIVRGSVRAVLKAIRNYKTPEEVMKRLAWTIKAEDQDQLKKILMAKMYSIIDKAYQKGVIHRNKAARHKAQIAEWFNNLQAQ